MKINTYDPKKQKLVLAGTLVNGVFTKKVSSKHYMKIVQGYGIQEDVIRQLAEAGCKKIILKTVTGNLESDFSDWLSPSIKVLDYGHGKQRFFPDRLMHKKSVDRITSSW